MNSVDNLQMKLDRGLFKKWGENLMSNSFLTNIGAKFP
jgi:hypothetical protein